MSSTLTLGLVNSIVVTERQDGSLGDVFKEYIRDIEGSNQEALRARSRLAHHFNLNRTSYTPQKASWIARILDGSNVVSFSGPTLWHRTFPGLPLQVRLQVSLQGKPSELYTAAVCSCLEGAPDVWFSLFKEYLGKKECLFSLTFFTLAGKPLLRIEELNIFSFLFFTRPFDLSKGDADDELLALALRPFRDDKGYMDAVETLSQHPYVLKNDAHTLRYLSSVWIERMSQKSRGNYTKAIGYASSIIDRIGVLPVPVRAWLSRIEPFCNEKERKWVDNLFARYLFQPALTCLSFKRYQQIVDPFFLSTPRDAKLEQLLSSKLLAVLRGLQADLKQHPVCLSLVRELQTTSLSPVSIGPRSNWRKVFKNAPEQVSVRVSCNKQHSPFFTQLAAFYFSCQDPEVLLKVLSEAFQGHKVELTCYMETRKGKYYKVSETNVFSLLFWTRGFSLSSCSQEVLAQALHPIRINSETSYVTCDSLIQNQSDFKSEEASHFMRDVLFNVTLARYAGCDELTKMQTVISQLVSEITHFDSIMPTQFEYLVNVKDFLDGTWQQEIQWALSRRFYEGRYLPFDEYRKYAHKEAAIQKTVTVTVSDVASLLARLNLTPAQTVGSPMGKLFIVMPLAKPEVTSRDGFINDNSSCWLISLMQALFQLTSIAIQIDRMAANPENQILTSLKALFLAKKEQRSLQELDVIMKAFLQRLSTSAHQEYQGKKVGNLNDPAPMYEIICEMLGRQFVLKKRQSGLLKDRSEHLKEEQEHFRTLALGSKNVNSLDGALRLFFSEEMHLTDDENAWRIERPDNPPEFCREYRIERHLLVVPQVLVLQFNRETPSQLLTVRFDQNAILDLSQYVAPELKQNARYKLKSYIVYRLLGSHYVTHVREGNAWYEHNDSHPKKLLTGSELAHTNAHMLFFERTTEG